MCIRYKPYKTGFQIYLGCVHCIENHQSHIMCFDLLLLKYWQTSCSTWLATTSSVIWISRMSRFFCKSGTHKYKRKKNDCKSIIVGGLEQGVILWSVGVTCGIVKGVCKTLPPWSFLKSITENVYVFWEYLEKLNKKHIGTFKLGGMQSGGTWHHS